MGSLVVLGFEPGPEEAVELGQVAEDLRREVGHKGRPDMAEETLDLASPTGPVRPGVDQGDVERGADDLQVVGAEGGAVVAVQPPWQAAARTPAR